MRGLSGAEGYERYGILAHLMHEFVEKEGPRLRRFEGGQNSTSGMYAPKAH